MRWARAGGVLAALLATACTATTAETDGAAVSSTTAPAPQLEAAAPYVPLPGEPASEVKQLAADVVQALGTYSEGEGTVEAAQGRLEPLAAEPAVAAGAGPLLRTGAAATDIIYPQLGGLTDTEASIMLVTRQRTLDGANEESITRTIDVRLSLGTTGWSVTELASTGGTPVEAPAALSPAAEAVLVNPGLELPDSARWDIQAGTVEDRVLELLDRLGREQSISVTVLATGHPTNVFGTDSVSNHTAGRGVDIWAVDGVPVVDQRLDGGPLYALVARLLGEGSITELGSPWDLDGPGAGASFTNTVHQDHLHLAFDGP